jgi:hypothetical protein
MKRAFAIVASACLILAMGCSNYDTRLGTTLEEMRYRKRLDENLLPAATKGKLEEFQIFVRPPKNLKGPTQTFAWTVIEPGRFDLENSFIDQDKGESLHILVRVKKPKAPASTKKGATPTEAVPRGDFTTEVIDLIKSVYGVEIDETKKLKPDIKKHGNRENDFKSTTLEIAAKEVQVYLYGDKNGPYEVALIFDYPTEEKKTIDSKIRLSLEAFAVGEAARHAFSDGGEGEGEGGEEGSGGEPPPI